jgi:hypothetical protein
MKSDFSTMKSVLTNLTTLVNVSLVSRGYHLPDVKLIYQVIKLRNDFMNITAINMANEKQIVQEIELVKNSLENLVQLLNKTSSSSDGSSSDKSDNGFEDFDNFFERANLTANVNSESMSFLTRTLQFVNGTMIITITPEAAPISFVVGFVLTVCAVYTVLIYLCCLCRKSNCCKNCKTTKTSNNDDVDSDSDSDMYLKAIPKVLASSSPKLASSPSISIPIPPPPPIRKSSLTSRSLPSTPKLVNRSKYVTPPTPPPTAGIVTQVDIHSESPKEPEPTSFVEELKRTSSFKPSDVRRASLNKRRSSTAV